MFQHYTLSSYALTCALLIVEHSQGMMKGGGERAKRRGATPARRRSVSRRRAKRAVTDLAPVASRWAGQSAWLSAGLGCGLGWAMVWTLGWALGVRPRTSAPLASKPGEADPRARAFERRYVYG